MSKRLYRDRKNGKLLGVCAGFGDYSGIDPNLIRGAWIIFIFMSFFLGIILYFAFGLILEDKPYSADSTDLVAQENNRPDAVIARIDRLSADMAGLETALIRLEAYVTSDAFTLQRKIWQLKQ